MPRDIWCSKIKSGITYLTLVYILHCFCHVHLQLQPYLELYHPICGVQMLCHSLEVKFILRNRFCRYYFSLRWKTASIKTAVEWLGETCRHVQKMQVDGNAKKHIHVEKMMTKFDICLLSVTICQFLFPMLSASRHESIKSISRNDELIWDVYA